MQSLPMIFSHRGFGSLRAVTGKNGEPWFVASDMAKALGYANPSEAVRDNCKKVNKITQPSSELGRPPVTYNIIPESDVYRFRADPGLLGKHRRKEMNHG
jgi:prophage antirepressor-like protein